MANDAHRRALKIFQLTCPKDLAFPSSLCAEPPELKGDDDKVNWKRLEKFKSLLLKGAVFKKYKRGRNVKTRMIWCTPYYDFLLWGDPDKIHIKGGISTWEITEVNLGEGAGRRNWLYVVSQNRTLELEAKDSHMAKEWQIALQILLKSHYIEFDKARSITRNPQFKNLYIAFRKTHMNLLTKGDVFKKWPARTKSKKIRNFTVRKLWMSDNMERLIWGDIYSLRSRGSLFIADVVHITEDPDDPLKFCVEAFGRSLDLEAKTNGIREMWIRALRFVIFTK